MRALLFEVLPAQGQYDNYLAIAASLKPELDALGGCLFLDRFKSRQRPSIVLSHQIWRDEAAMTAWRVHHPHHQAQSKGRTKVFENYRLTVGDVVREENVGAPAWIAAGRSTYVQASTRKPRFVILAESISATFDAPGGIAVETFTSITRENEHMHVLRTPDWSTALEITEQCSTGGPAYRYRICEVDREYGMLDRAEAPQYFPPRS
jgi:heme-degrading monooxygenase HmoA